TNHPAMVSDIRCYGGGAIQLQLGVIRSLSSAVGVRLSLCRVIGTLPGICAGHDWLARCSSDRHAPSPAPHPGRPPRGGSPPACEAFPLPGVSRRRSAPTALPSRPPVSH